MAVPEAPEPHGQGWSQHLLFPVPTCCDKTYLVEHLQGEKCFILAFFVGMEGSILVVWFHALKQVILTAGGVCGELLHLMVDRKEKG